MTNKHIGSNFDDFLKEECIKFEEQEFEKGINIPSRQIIIDGVNVSELTSDQLACMNRYSVARLFIELVKQLKLKEQECKANDDLALEYFNKIMILEDVNYRLKRALIEIKSLTESEEYVGFWEDCLS